MDQVERLGFGLIKASSIEAGELAVRTDAAIGCIVLEWGPDEPLADVNRFISFLRGRGLAGSTFRSLSWFVDTPSKRFR